MTEKDRLSGKVRHYERLLNEMQDHVFFVQDDDGVLRRWYPPKTMLNPEPPLLS